MSEKLKLVLVDDDPLVRSALTLMLGAQPDLELVGEAGDGEAGLELIRRVQPDVVLMDIRMPKLDGLSATERLFSTPGVRSKTRVIVLTTFDADDQVLGAISAGADGFLLKDTPPQEIVAAIGKVAAGEPMLSPSVTRTLLDRFRSGDEGRRSAARKRLDSLTERELEIAHSVASGLSNAEIAARFHLSIPTVKAHVSRVFDKLAVTNRVQIAICVHDAK